MIPHVTRLGWEHISLTGDYIWADDAESCARSGQSRHCTRLEFQFRSALACIMNTFVSAPPLALRRVIPPLPRGCFLPAALSLLFGPVRFDPLRHRARTRLCFVGNDDSFAPCDLLGIRHLRRTRGFGPSVRFRIFLWGMLIEKGPADRSRFRVAC